MVVLILVSLFGLRAKPSVGRDALVPPHNVYDCPRFRRGGAEPPRVSVFWGSTVPPRPYSLPLDGEPPRASGLARHGARAGIWLAHVRLFSFPSILSRCRYGDRYVKYALVARGGYFVENNAFALTPATIPSFPVSAFTVGAGASITTLITLTPRER